MDKNTVKRDGGVKETFIAMLAVHARVQRLQDHFISSRDPRNEEISNANEEQPKEKKAYLLTLSPTFATTPTIS